MSQVQNTCSEEPASYRLLGAGVTASYRLLGAGVMDDGRLEGWDWIVKVNPSISCFQTVRMRGCVIEICQILKLNCELNIKGQCKERCRDQAHAALYQPHSNQDGQCWTLEEEEVVGMKILTSDRKYLVPLIKIGIKKVLGVAYEDTLLVGGVAFKKTPCQLALKSRRRCTRSPTSPFSTLSSCWTQGRTKPRWGRRTWTVDVPEGGGRRVEHPLQQAEQDLSPRGQDCPLQDAYWRLDTFPTERCSALVVWFKRISTGISSTSINCWLMIF